MTCTHAHTHTDILSYSGKNTGLVRLSHALVFSYLLKAAGADVHKHVAMAMEQRVFNLVCCVCESVCIFGLLRV